MTHYRIIDDMTVSGKALAGIICALPEWRRKEAMAFKHENGRRECAMSYLLLCDMLQQHCGITLQPLFRKGEHGKPELYADESTPLTDAGGSTIRFNLSHCKKAIACVISTDGEVGIDVECLGRYSQSLAEYCMSEAELQEIADADDHDLRFTQLWTRKEALLKYTGEGITDDIKQCLSSARTIDIGFKEGYKKEKGYVWTTATKPKE